LVQLTKKEIRGHQSELLKFIYYPYYYHTLMQRLNILHCSLNKYMKELLKSS